MIKHAHEWIAAMLTAMIGMTAGIASAQGSLTPPGPPAPMMKTLDQIEARTPILSLPFTITNSGSYYLTTSLYADSGNGIIISKNNVTVDLNGFALSGGEASSYGIYIIGGQTNITVRNGSLSGWNYGVYTSSASSRNIVVEHLAVSAGNYGICVQGCQITDCAAIGTGSDGITAYNGCVRNCRAAQNGGVGIYVAPGNVSGCWVQNNSHSGIYVGAAGSEVTGNTCVGNNTSASGSDAGVCVGSANNRIEGNHVSASGSEGIRVNSSSYTNNIIVRNSVSGNGANNYVTPGNQVVGPLITTSGTITNANAWANFSF